MKESCPVRQITPSIFNQNLQMRCQNIGYYFLYLLTSGFLIYLISEATYPFSNLFTFLGHSAKEKREELRVP